MNPPAAVEPASASAHGTAASAFAKRRLARGTAASAFAKRPLPAFAGRPPAFASRGHHYGGLLITFLHIKRKTGSLVSLRCLQTLRLPRLVVIPQQYHS